jgi:hypothetical protein
MNMRSWAIGLACSLMITLTSGRAEAGQIQSKGSFSGTIVSTESDTNGDGQKAILYILGLKGTLGQATQQAMVEFEFGDLANPVICPNGNPGVQFTPVPGGAAHIVRRYDSTGDLLFFHITSASGCFDLVTQLQFASGTGEIIGGTGRFEGATGTTDFSGTATTLFLDEAGNFFVQVSGTIKDTIITP